MGKRARYGDSEQKRGVKIGKLKSMVGLVELFSRIGSFPLEDTGISIVVCIFQRSLSKGRYNNTLQFETVKTLRFTYSNIWYASRHTLTTSVMMKDLKKIYVTSCPAYGLWFERLVIWIYKWIGDEVHQE